MKQLISFFICGTPSDKKGFEYKSLDGSKLPGIPSKYLDVFDKSTMSIGRTYCIKSIKIQGKSYSVLTVYQRINPNDSKSSRGAYIAVGAISPFAVSPDQSISCFNIISEIHGNLACLRKNHNAFDNDFDLKGYTYPALNIDLPISYITYKYCNALSQKNNVIKFNDVSESKRSHQINKEYQISLYRNKSLPRLKSLSENAANIIHIDVKNNPRQNTSRMPSSTQSHRLEHELEPTSGNYAPYPSRVSRKHKQSWLKKYWPDFPKGKRTISIQMHDENVRKRKRGLFITIALCVIGIPLIAITIYAGYYFYTDSLGQTTSTDKVSPGKPIETDESLNQLKSSNNSNDTNPSSSKSWATQQKEAIQNSKRGSANQ